MLNIIRTNLRSLDSREMEDSIIDLVNRGERVYLIVPEQDTVSREVRMSELLPPSAALQFEVTNFSRFSDIVFRAKGGITGEYCDTSKRSLLMWRTLTELRESGLNMLRANREISAGLVENMLMAVKEMQAHGITTDKLNQAAVSPELSTDKRLEAKLCDLAKIYSRYKAIVGERYAETGDINAMVKKKLEDNPTFLSGTHIFLDGFTSFTTPQYELIGLLAERCTLTVYIPQPKEDKYAFEYSEMTRAISNLISKTKCDDKHTESRIDPTAKRCESAIEISKYLWRKEAGIDKITLQNPDEIRIFEAQSPFEMCDFVAADIKRRILNGAAYSDIAILMRRPEDYEGLLDMSMRDADIPVFFSSRKDASATEAIKLIYTAFSVLRNRYAREDVISYAKCGLAGIDRAECDELETYLGTWNLSGSRFTDGVVWNMNPRGYRKRESYDTEGIERDKEKLARINDIRSRLIEPLMQLESAFKGIKTVREGAKALLDFLVMLRLEKKLADRAEHLSSLGEWETAEDNRKLWALICKSLDTLVEVSGDCPCNREDFFGQFKILISSIDLGYIPSYTDTVTVGAVDMLRLRDKKHVYLIGVNLGELPSAPTDSSFFTEGDKDFLAKKALLTISKEMEGKNARELFLVSRAFSYPTETLTLLYSRTNNKYKAIKPSPIIKRIDELTDGAVTPVSISSLPHRDRIYSAEAALRRPNDIDEVTELAIRSALRRTGHGDILSVSDSPIDNGGEKLSEDVSSTIYNGKIVLSNTRIEAFVKCPLSYFCKHVLHLEEEEKAEFNAMNVGTFIHSLLEQFFSSLKEKNMKPSELTAEDRKQLTRQIAKDYIDSFDEAKNDTSPATMVKLDRLERAAIPIVDSLCDEFTVSSFAPTHFELDIKRDGTDPAPASIKSEGGRTVVVHGKVDRVDTFEKDGKIYIRVIDYKTGNKTFAVSDIAEGKSLQMFLYLKCLLESKGEKTLRQLGVEGGKELAPAGVIYVKTSVADVKCDTLDDAGAMKVAKDNQTRSGMVLDDADVYNAMGIRYTPLGSEKNPDVLNKNYKARCFTEQTFPTYMAAVEKSVGDVADRMAGGEIAASPDGGGLHSKCNNCEFKYICRKLV